jgi:hypothetical protein
MNLRHLAFELDAVGTVSGHSFHPPKAQLQGQFPRPQLSGLRGALQSRVKVQRRLRRILSKWQMRYARDRLAGFDENRQSRRRAEIPDRNILALLDTKLREDYANSTWFARRNMSGDSFAPRKSTYQVANPSARAMIPSSWRKRRSVFAYFPWRSFGNSMTRPRTPFRQADISRAVKGATAAGLVIGRVEIDPNGTIVIVSGDAADQKVAGAVDARTGIIARRLKEARHG